MSTTISFQELGTKSGGGSGFGRTAPCPCPGLALLSGRRPLISATCLPSSGGCFQRALLYTFNNVKTPQTCRIWLPRGLRPCAHQALWLVRWVPSWPTGPARAAGWLHHTLPSQGRVLCGLPPAHSSKRHADDPRGRCLCLWPSSPSASEPVTDTDDRDAATCDGRDGDGARRLRARREWPAAQRREGGLGQTVLGAPILPPPGFQPWGALPFGAPYLCCLSRQPRGHRVRPTVTSLDLFTVKLNHVGRATFWSTRGDCVHSA